MPLSYTAGHLSDREARQRAEEMLCRVGLKDRLDHEPPQLSGGEQQKMAIARALINRPPLLFADEPTGNLDSRTSGEVLRIFQQLNEEDRITIVLVTHDANVARHARRVIRIHDGAIVEDALAATAEPTEPQAALAPPWRRREARDDGPPYIPNSGEGTALQPDAGHADDARDCHRYRGCHRHDGDWAGSSSALQKTISTMGANVLLVMPGTAASGGVSFGAGSVTTLTPEDCTVILQECPAIRSATPAVRARTQVLYGNRNWVPSGMYGTTPAFLDVRDWALSDGEPFTDRDVSNANKVCVLGQTLVRELFQGESPVGKDIRVKNVSFRVVGVLSTKGANMMGMDQDDILLAPWTTIKYRITGSPLATANQSAASGSGSSVNTLSNLYPSSGPNLYPERSEVQAADNPMPVRFANIDQILAAAQSSDRIPAAIQQMTGILRERHRIRTGEPDDFNIRDMTEAVKTLSSTTRLMTNLLLCVAMISLVVGGVGIMNIMLVSVTERTRETGLRMAVGARARDILRQFLVEAVILCLAGGVMGILLGHGGSHLVRLLLRWPVETSLMAIATAVSVSASVAIVFGYYPAWKASRLDPIEALRYE